MTFGSWPKGPQASAVAPAGGTPKMMLFAWTYLLWNAIRSSRVRAGMNHGEHARGRAAGEEGSRLRRRQGQDRRDQSRAQGRRDVDEDAAGSDGRRGR